MIAAGCDPGIGILHADRQGRDSFAFDVLEPVRPHVDAYVLRLVREHTFSPDDFFENRQGACRIMPPLAHRFAETASQWAKLLDPIAHRCSRRFERAGALGTTDFSEGGKALPTDADSRRLPPLLRARKTLDSRRAPEPAVSDRRCRRCGAVLEAKARRVYCPACTAMLPRWRQSTH